MKGWLVITVPLLFAPAAQGQDAAPLFVERPGIIEFSGQMIVRPIQPADLRVRGASEEEARPIRDRAAARLTPQVLEYVPATDEYIVALLPGETENSFAARLMSTGDYEYAVPNWICHPTATIPNDGDYHRQWHHAKVRSPLAWDISTGNPGLVVADVDGGVELTHPDLAGALVPGYNSHDHLPQQDGGDVSDVDGHGTFVIGLSGAIGNNYIDVVGMGWHFSLMPIRYYNSPGGGYLGDLLDGARWAVDHGAKCVNVSQTGVEYSPVQTTGAYITSHGGLLFWAAGNDGRNLYWFHWEDVIVVGATDPNDARPDWSAYGHAVDVFAPGTDMLSTGIPGVLAIGSGTSASTAIVSGLAALVWSAQSALSPEQVKQRLFAGCVDLGAPGHDDTWGWGRVDAYGAVGLRVGDCNCDGNVDFADIDPFVLAITNQAQYVHHYPGCGWLVHADCNGDGQVSFADIDPFVALLGGG